jgi:hypothetical protein
MDLKQLQAMGALVPRTLFKKEIPFRRPVLKPTEEWSNAGEPEESGEFVDDTVTAWIRKRSSADFLEMIQAPDRDKAHIAVLRCVCLEDGAEVFESLAQAKQLKEWLFLPLMMAVNQVNEFGLKNSHPRTSSGTSSRSSSGAPSRKLKRGAARKNGRHGSPTAPSAAP